MTNIVLCGGSGTRLWPISRKLMPKQFIKIIDNESLFQKTIKRNKNLSSDFLIVSNKEQYSLAQAQISECCKNENVKFLLEPIGRNTAPAIALACMSLNRDDIVLVTPSDHIIKNLKEYKKVIDKAKDIANKGYLVTFGIKPTYPETEFGYIETNNNDVLSFKEKPNYDIAKYYINKGNFYWNSGIFCFKAGVFLDELKKYAFDIYSKSVSTFNNASKVNNKITINLDDMNNIPENSIDYAVMEQSKLVKVVKSDIDWNDLGKFESIHEEIEKDLNNNSKLDNLHILNSKNNFIYCDTNKTISLIDIEDLVIVDTPDALLITKQGSSQKVKEIVKKLKNSGSDIINTHLKVYRPWGSYDVLDTGEKYKVKKIIVKPGKRLSLQKHFHRSEHWIVVSGIATVTIGENRFKLRPNESTYIKIGEIHRLENEGETDVVLIEAQVGSYVEEDDIERIEDDYKRI